MLLHAVERLREHKQTGETDQASGDVGHFVANSVQSHPHNRTNDARKRCSRLG